MIHPNSGIEDHPTGTGDINRILNSNWTAINNWINPAYGLTGSQSGTTVTASGDAFRSDDVGAKIVFLNGTTATITAFSDTQHVTVAETQTVATQSFEVYRSDATAVDAVVRALTKYLRMTSSENGKVMRWNSTAKRFDMVTQTGFGVTAGRIVFGNGAGNEAIESADFTWDDTLKVLTVNGQIVVNKTLIEAIQTATASTSSTNVDGAQGNIFDITLATATTAIDMNNVKAGAFYMFNLRQDATGGRAVTWASKFKFPKSVAPEISTAANALTSVIGFAVSSTEIVCTPSSDFVLKTGGTLTGNLTLANDPTNALHAATKQYVDAQSSGVFIKQACRAATTTALPANTFAANSLTATSNGALAAIDGVTLVLNDRLLVQNEGTSANNGLYYVAQVGDASHPYILTRTTDADTSAEVTSGLTTYISEGTANGGKEFVLITPNTITLNTTGLTFSQRTTIIADGAATDAKIGNRTIDDTLATPANTGTLTQLLSWLGGRLKAITGKSDWITAPDVTLGALFARVLADWSGASDNPIETTGTFGSGAAISGSGARTTMFWYPKKSAFYAGTSLSTEFDDANIGNYSINFGYQTIASNTASVSIGFGGIASGQQSIVVNNGGGSSATALTSSVFGGVDSVASFEGATTLGGHSPLASGYFSTTVGGFGLIAQGYLQTVVGSYNIPQGTGSSLVYTDQCFIVGNGTNVTPSTAFAVRWQGQIDLGPCTVASSPQVAQFWYDSTFKTLAHYETIGQVNVSGLAFANTANATTVSNTTTETNFDQNWNVAADGVSVGKIFRITASGKYSSSSTPGNLTLKIKKGTSVLVAIPATALRASQSNAGWEFDALISFRSVGSGGTVMASGKCFIDDGARSGPMCIPSNGTKAWDTTVGTTLQCSAQFSVANASNSITLEQFIVEVLN